LGDLLHFILLALALLAAPGPTNALLATAGATQPLRKALPLLAAELVGYAVALLLLILAVGPVIAGHPAFAWTLRIAATLYLLFLAATLWGHRLDAYVGRSDVRFRQVLIATLLNPKSLVLAFVLLPVPQPPLLHLIALAVLIALTGGGWVLLGRQVRLSAGEDVRLSTLRRGGAVVIALFALLLPASVLWS
jgi:threonine/homoserine/homoserine lactone efflux protein